MDRDRWPAYLNMLMYPLSTSRDVLGALDFCVRSLEEEGAPMTEYLDAIRSALASGDPIGVTVGLEQHAESSLREFLVAAERRLAESLAK